MDLPIMSEEERDIISVDQVETESCNIWWRSCDERCHQL